MIPTIPRFGSRRRPTQSSWLAVAGLLVLLNVPAALRAEGFSGELHLVLREALFHDPEQTRVPLVLHLVARDGEWERVWGKAQDFGIGDHHGIVESAEAGPETLGLDVVMMIEGDSWNRGSWPGIFRIELDRGSGRELTGRYTGRFRNQALTGVVEGVQLAPRPLRPGFEPPAPDERPRVLLRRSELPALRARLDTPFGQAYRERARASADPLNLGILYQLTGDAAHARQAEAALVRRHPERIPWGGYGSGGFGHDIVNAALAYDLCADAWSEPFRNRIYEELVQFAERHQTILMTTYANFHPCSNYYGPGRGAAGLVALVVWDGADAKAPPPPTPAPAGPTPPDTGRQSVVAAGVRSGAGPADLGARVRQIPPPPDVEPGSGAEGVVWTMDAFPAKGWITSGPLPARAGPDVLGDVGGYLRARPSAGDTVRYAVPDGLRIRRETFTFAPVPEGVAGPEGLDLKRAGFAEEGSVAVFHIAVRVEEAQALRWLPRTNGERLFLSGVEIEPDRFFTPLPGVHPLTLEVRARADAGRAGPRFLPPPEDPLDHEDSARHAMARRIWRHEQEIFQRTGVNPERQFWVERTWWQILQHIRWGVGDGGFLAETGGYAGIASWFPLVYAGVYPHFAGRDVSPFPDISHLLPRQTLQAVFPEEGGMRLDGIQSATILSPRWIAAGFPALSEAHRGPLHWVWNRLAGITDPEDPGQAALLFEAGRGEVSALTLAQTFVNYPLGETPVHPRDRLPRTWRADTFGFHVARSGWNGGDDFVGQVFLKAAPIVGWSHPNAGAVQVSGLGRAWTATRSERGGARENYSVVLLPDDKINQGSNARLIHYEAEDDGSMSLTMDLNDVYASPGSRPMDSMFVRHPGLRKDSGITGFRAVAFDYSGRSGAPALMVLVDRVDGGGRKLWTWHTAGAEASAAGRGFALAADGAEMRAVFASPPAVEVRAETAQVEAGDARTGYHGSVRRIVATGGDHFFMVATFQPAGDPAPEITVEGEGLHAVVRVGGQTVRFRDARIEFGPGANDR